MFYSTGLLSPLAKRFDTELERIRTARADRGFVTPTRRTELALGYPLEDEYGLSLAHTRSAPIYARACNAVKHLFNDTNDGPSLEQRLRTFEGDPYTELAPYLQTSIAFGWASQAEPLLTALLKGDDPGFSPSAAVEATAIRTGAHGTIQVRITGETSLELELSALEQAFYLTLHELVFSARVAAAARIDDLTIENEDWTNLMQTRYSDLSGLLENAQFTDEEVLAFMESFEGIETFLDTHADPLVEAIKTAYHDGTLAQLEDHILTITDYPRLLL